MGASGNAGELKPTIDSEPAEAIAELAACRAPYLIGIRHHSPMLAAVVPRLLDAAAPDLVLLELPDELQPWLNWLGAKKLHAPVALAASRRDGQGLVFYPYADFSPELAALRWAQAHGVPVQAFDLPVGLATDEGSSSRKRLAPATELPLTQALRRAARADDADELWDRMVEVRAAGAEPEAIRRAALAVAWGLRTEQRQWGEVPPSDLRREAWMRERLAAAMENGVSRPAAVVGAFHVAAFVGVPVTTKRRAEKRAEVITSLVPYDFELLDSRTGYPAGIRDPEWQQAIWEQGGRPDGALHAVTDAAIKICRELRRAGQPAGVADAREVVRLAVDLARLRGMPAPGRRELIEGLQTALAQGEPMGRGRTVARAMQSVLVGSRRGRLAPGTPRSGLVPHVEELLAELRLPGPGHHEPVEIRLDPLRGKLDRRRHIALQRLIACNVPYAHPISVEPDQVTGLWILRWAPATSAMLELAGSRGTTLAQAAEGSLRMRYRRQEPTARLRLDTLESAAECALPALVRPLIEDIAQNLPHEARLSELVEALDLCDRLLRGHVPGYEASAAIRKQLAESVVPMLVAAAVNGVDGLAGSDELEDALALLTLVQRVSRHDVGRELGDGRLRWALEQLERDGSPLMQGASGAVRVLLGHLEADAFGERMASWLDDATTLSRRIAGALTMAAPLLEAAPSIVERLIKRVGRLDDEAFLQRLAALRDGFDVLSPAARQRFLQALHPMLADDFDSRLDDPAELLARWAEADRYGREAVEGMGVAVG